MPSHFKRRVRERMVKTGESWAHAQRYERARGETSPIDSTIARPTHHDASAAPIGRGDAHELDVAAAQFESDGRGQPSRARTDIAELKARLMQLGEAIECTLDAPNVTAAALSRLSDIVRWTRFYVNLSLAFRRQIHPLRDEAWVTARYTDEPAARNLLAAFRRASEGLTASRLDLVALRNLSARVEGLTRVVHGWQRALG